MAKCIEIPFIRRNFTNTSCLLTNQFISILDHSPHNSLNTKNCLRNHALNTLSIASETAWPNSQSGTRAHMYWRQKLRIDLSVAPCWIHKWVCRYSATWLCVDVYAPFQPVHVLCCHNRQHLPLYFKVFVHKQLNSTQIMSIFIVHVENVYKQLLQMSGYWCLLIS